MKILLALLPLAACAAIPQPARYDGPGDEKAFYEARYACLQETRAAVSSSETVGAYGGAARSEVVPICSHFMACITARGYRQEVDGRFDAGKSPVRCKR